VRIIPVLFGLLMLVEGCGKQSVTNMEQPMPYPINVDFQTGFDNDSAIVMIDGATVASVDSITTSPIVVLAASRRFTLVPGTHVLSVLIRNDTVRTDTTFVHVEKELWVGVNYVRNQRTIQYLFQYSPFPYR
jgi:hypothetical protein